MTREGSKWKRSDERGEKEKERVWGVRGLNDAAGMELRAGEERVCLEFEALNCFLKLSSSSSGASLGRPTTLTVVLGIAPFAFYLGMFNISFPYRGCKRARVRLRRQANKTDAEEEGGVGGDEPSITGRLVFAPPRQLTLPSKEATRASIGLSIPGAPRARSSFGEKQTAPARPSFAMPSFPLPPPSPSSFLFSPAEKRRTLLAGSRESYSGESRTDLLPPRQSGTTVGSRSCAAKRRLFAFAIS